jgi:hypothetical protein
MDELKKKYEDDDRHRSTYKNVHVVQGVNTGGMENNNMAWFLKTQQEEISYVDSEPSANNQI